MMRALIAASLPVRCNKWNGPGLGMIPRGKCQAIARRLEGRFRDNELGLRFFGRALAARSIARELVGALCTLGRHLPALERLRNCALGLDPNVTLGGSERHETKDDLPLFNVSADRWHRI